jgi:hypothetical protein
MNNSWKLHKTTLLKLGEHKHVICINFIIAVVLTAERRKE